MNVLDLYISKRNTLIVVNLTQVASILSMNSILSTSEFLGKQRSCLILDTTTQQSMEFMKPMHIPNQIYLK